MNGKDRKKVARIKRIRKYANVASNPVHIPNSNPVLLANQLDNRD
jgi:hypothetical protein